MLRLRWGWGLIIGYWGEERVGENSEKYVEGQKEKNE